MGGHEGEASPQASLTVRRNVQRPRHANSPLLEVCELPSVSVAIGLLRALAYAGLAACKTAHPMGR